MYCSNCGIQLADNSKFCNNCGTPINNSNIVETRQTQLEPTYNRDVVILHLRDLRFLEIAREKLSKDIDNIDYKINNYGFSKKFYRPQRSSSGMSSDEFFEMFGPMLGGIGILLIGWLIDMLIYSMFHSHFIIIIAAIIASIFIIWSVIAIVDNYSGSTNSRKSYELACKKYDEDVVNDEKRVQWELQEKERLASIRSQMYDEWQRIDALLKKTYDINIIPSQFRGLYAVYYLFEFLSTSQETLKEALLHCDLDEIKRKLDIIIQQQEQIILNQELQSAQLDGLRQQNDEMLKYAIETEKNTNMSAKYSQVAATNTEALFYMSVAQYIRQAF